MHKESCGYDHMLVTHGYMRPLYPLLHGPHRLFSWEQLPQRPLPANAYGGHPLTAGLAA